MKRAELFLHIILSSVWLVIRKARIIIPVPNVPYWISDWFRRSTFVILDGEPCGGFLMTIGPSTLRKCCEKSAEMFSLKHLCNSHICSLKWTNMLCRYGIHYKAFKSLITLPLLLARQSCHPMIYLVSCIQNSHQELGANYM